MIRRSRTQILHVNGYTATPYLLEFQQDVVTGGRLIYKGTVFMGVREYRKTPCR